MQRSLRVGFSLFCVLACMRERLAEGGVGPAEPSPSEIVAVVKDSSGRPVPEVIVAVQGASKGEGRTDERGQVTFSNLTEGVYLVVAVREGFAKAELSVAMGAGQRREVSLVLAPANYTEYVETVSKIIEPSLEVPIFVSGVTNEEIQRTAPVTLEDAMRSIPGLQFATQANVFTRFETRGLRDTKDVLVLVDGVPIRQLEGSNDVTVIPASVLRSIEFAKGPSSSIYGRSAIGGVVEFSTVPEDANKRTADLALTAASWNTVDGLGNVQIPWSNGRLSAAGEVSHSDTYQQRTGRDTDFFTAAARYNPSPGLATKVQYLFSHVNAGRGTDVPLRNGLPLFGITPEDNFAIPGASFNATLNSLTFRTDLTTLGRGMLLTNTANVQRYSRLYFGGVQLLPPPSASTKNWFEDDSRQDTFIDDLLLRWDGDIGGARSTLLAGATAEVGRENLRAPDFTSAPKYLGPDYINPVPGPNANNDPRGIRTPDVFSYYRQTIFSGYLQERIQWGRVGGVVGLRWDHFDQNFTESDITGAVSADVRSRVSPRVGLDIATVRRDGLDLAVFGNYAEGFRPQFPALDTLSGITVPQLLRPEVTRSYEGGAKARIAKGRLFAQASFFNERKIDGERSYRNGPDEFLFTNATFRVKGVETEFRAQPSKTYSFFVHYSYHDAKYIDFGTRTANYAGNTVRMSPHHIAGAGYSLSVGRVTWTSSLSYVGSRPLRDSVFSPQILPSYTTLDSSLMAEFGRARVVLSGTNLTDEFYIADDYNSTDSGYPGPPRRVALQLRYRFQ
jgi:outer membrane receptor protein involved in Fe transport